MNKSCRTLQGLTYYSPSRAYNGYTLFTPMAGQGAWLINMEGQFVHNWGVDLDAACYGQLLPNGHLLYAGKLLDAPIPDFGGLGGKLIEMDWDGNVIWEYEDGYMHHDFQRLPNGNTMVLRWVRTPDDIAAKIKGGIPGTEDSGAIWADAFREITPEGEVVWEWLSYEHLDPEADAICPLCTRSDWVHANACSVLPDGNILTSLLKLNTIAIIDKATGDFKWRWGSEELAHQHNPTLLENGNILVFDNGTHRPDNLDRGWFGFDFSRVLEVDPKSNEIVWEYMDETVFNFHACYISGCQRLPNGNTLICDGPVGRIFEVTPDKELVWEYISPFYSWKIPFAGFANPVFQAYRFAPDYPGLKGKELDTEKVMLTLRKIDAEKVEREKALRSRLERLGY